MYPSPDINRVIKRKADWKNMNERYKEYIQNTVETP